MWVTAKEAKDILKITSKTLNVWKKEGKIQVNEITKRKFMYFVELDNLTTRKNVVYARVSNTKQSDDLARQIKLIKEYMIAKGIIPDHVYSEIASGMNESRKELQNLLKEISEKKINKVYISYKDRLTRFGFGYFEQICRLFGTEIEVINLTDESDFQTELTDDLVSIIHHFSMKMYSNRRKILKQAEKDLKNIDIE
jgi:predicted site-specific integrase-resolvase